MAPPGPYEKALRLLASIEGPLRRHELDAAGRRKARAAEAALREAADVPAFRARALVRLGWLLRWLGALDEAEAAFDAVPPEAPEWRDAALGKADLLMMRARLPAAVEVLRRALNRYPDDAGLNAALGACLYHEKDLDGAVRALERALEVLPSHKEAGALLRMIRRERERPREPDPPVDEAERKARLDRALERALEAVRNGPGTPEEKAAGEARLRDVHRRRAEGGS